MPLSTGTRKVWENTRYSALPTCSVFKHLGLCQTERREKCSFMIVTIVFPIILKEVAHLKWAPLKNHVPRSPFWSRQWTEGSNNSETKVSISWWVIEISSLRTSTCLFPFDLRWCAKLTRNMCQVEFTSLWCKRGSLFHICPSNFDVSLSRVWKCFPEKFSSKSSSFISYYDATAWRSR